MKLTKRKQKLLSDDPEILKLKAEYFKLASHEEYLKTVALTRRLDNLEIQIKERINKILEQ